MGNNHPKHRKIATQYLTIIVALVLVGQVPVLSLPLTQFGAYATQQMAGVVGMSVGVPQNESNKLAQDLAQKSEELTEREKAIDAREREIRLVVAEENAKYTKFILSVIIGITVLLTVLIILNFYLDKLRGEQLARSERSDVESVTTSEPHTKTGPHAHEGEFQTRI